MTDNNAQTDAYAPFWIGCAVWAYRGWLGSFYPPGTKSGDFLDLYTERLTCVEGNTTFYALPSEETVAGWAESMGPQFRFCPKLDRRVTHEGSRLEEGKHLTTTFLERMRGFGDNCGPVLVQLPPSYGPTELGDLANFIRWWPHGDVRMALEVRHQGWWLDGPREALHDLCATNHVGRVLLDTRPIYDGEDDPQASSERKKPEVPLEPILTSDFTFIRYIGHPLPERNDTYLAQWADQLAEWMRPDGDGATQIYFFAHCPMEERSPGYARDLQHRLEESGARVPPLPWDTIKDPPSQLGLF